MGARLPRPETAVTTSAGRWSHPSCAVKLARLGPEGDAQQALQTEWRIDPMACLLLSTKDGRPRKEDLSPPLENLGIPPSDDCCIRVWEREGGIKIHLTKGGTP
jgi:hypothetical protein